MNLIQEAIVKNGRVLPGGIVKVDGFLNHQLDVSLIVKIGEEIARRYAGRGVDKIVTCEASGIAVAFAAAMAMGVKAVFAKKGEARNIGEDVYCSMAHSYTRGREYGVFISKSYLGPDDNVLLVDDFLANGSAARTMIELCRQSGARIVGFCSVVTKTFQPGEALVRDMGVEVTSLVRIKSIEGDAVVFEES